MGIDSRIILKWAVAKGVTSCSLKTYSFSLFIDYYYMNSATWEIEYFVG